MKPKKAELNLILYYFVRLSDFLDKKKKIDNFVLLKKV